MSSRYEGSIYEVLSDESVTLGKVARKLDVNYKITRDILMHPALTRKDVRYKASDMIRIFWAYRATNEHQSLESTWKGPYNKSKKNS